MGNEKAVFEGRTLEDAVRKGLEEIGRTRAEVMITILEEGSGGFLGLGARPYKVRIMPRPGGAFREPEREREREGSRGGRGGRGRSEGGRAEGGRGREGRERSGARPARGERPERGERGDRSRREGAEGTRQPREAAARPVGERPVRDARPPRREERGREDRPMREAPPPREPETDSGQEPMRMRDDAPAGAGGGRRRRRGRRGGGTGVERGGRDESRREAPFQEASQPELAPRELTPVEAPPPREHDAEREPERYAGAATATSTPGMSPDELAATAKRITEEFFAKMGFETTVTAAAQEDHVDVAASVGAHEALLTGPKGEVRQSLQHLLNRMLNRGEGSRYHLQLEINEFWKHREDELRELAQRLAEEALESGAEAFTEYLNAQERRIVHVALKEDTRVKTYALGTGLIKRVAVAPADFPEGPRSD